MEVIRTIDLSKEYKTSAGGLKAIENVNLAIKKGEYVAITGESGAGKSTLMHLIGGLDRPTSGKVYIDGVSLYDEMNEQQFVEFRRKKIGFIFQAFNLIPFLNVWENIILPIGISGDSAKINEIKELMERLHIYEKRFSYPQQLSGGQQQRVAIARALAAKPSIIIADEPTGNLDSKTSEEVMELLINSCKRYNRTLVVVTHSERIACGAEKILRVVDGNIL